MFPALLCLQVRFQSAGTMADRQQMLHRHCWHWQLHPAHIKEQLPDVVRSGGGKGFNAVPSRRLKRVGDRVVGTRRSRPGFREKLSIPSSSFATNATDRSPKQKSVLTQNGAIWFFEPKGDCHSRARDHCRWRLCPDEAGRTQEVLGSKRCIFRMFGSQQYPGQH